MCKFSNGLLKSISIQEADSLYKQKYICIEISSAGEALTGISISEIEECKNCGDVQNAHQM